MSERQRKWKRLFHAAKLEWKCGRKMTVKSHVQTFRSDGERGATINWWYVAHAGVGRDDNRPKACP